MPTPDKKFAGGVTTMSTPLLWKVWVYLINRLRSTSIPPENRNYRNGKLVVNVNVIFLFSDIPDIPISRTRFVLGYFLASSQS